MALTLSITLDDETVEAYLEIINDGEQADVTVDSLNQNTELQAEIIILAQELVADHIYESYDELFE